MDSLVLYDQNLYLYPGAGEASTGLIRGKSDRPYIRTYETNLSKQKVSRASTKMRRYIKSNSLKLLVTLTYEIEPTFDDVRKDSSLWIRRLRSNIFLRAFPYIKVIEGFSDCERFHVHVALPVTNFQLILKSWSKGRVEIDEFERTDSEVIAKYLSKSIAENELRGRRSHSTGIGFSPKKFVIPINGEDPSSMLENRFKIKDLKRIETDYGFEGGGRFEFPPFDIFEAELDL